MAILEERYLTWLLRGSSVAPQQNPDKELRLLAAMTNRLTKVESPEILRPSGRFRTLPKALAEFEIVRTRSVQLVRERGDALYSIGVRHPYFGRLNAVELIHLIDGHARRHASQIREMRETLPAC